VVETPTLGLYACRGSVCERKERWFQPAGELARCSCARGRVDEPCNCEHELVGLYRLVVASTLAPPPDDVGGDCYTAGVTVAAFAVNAAGERLAEVGLDSVFVEQRRIVGDAGPGGSEVLLDRDGQCVRTRAQPVYGSRSHEWGRHVDLRGSYRWNVEATIAGSGVPVTVAVVRAVP